MRPMDLGLFQRLVDQAAEMRIPELTPNGYGEILTLPDLQTYLDYIFTRAHQFKVSINTNGYLMNDQTIELFLRYDVRLLNITLDGATQQTAEAVRVGLKTERIEHNIHQLLARREARGRTYPKLLVGMVVIPQNRHETDLFVKKWQGVADYVTVSAASTRLGSVAKVVDFVGDGVPVCVLPFRELNIWADGKAVLCCHDWNEELVVGDLNTQSLAEIWRGPALTRARELHRAERGRQMGICCKCNLWTAPSAGARLWS